MPDRNKLFARGEIFPSWWPNAIAAFLSTGALNFALERQSDTTIRVPAAASTGLVAIAIQGRWRYIEATATRVVAGAAGTKDIFVTTAANVITNVPDPNTDITNYAFALEVLTAGSTPAINPGVVDLFRKVGTLEWDGAKVTRMRALVNTINGGYVDTGWAGATGATIRKSLASSFTENELRDVLDTLIDVLIDRGILAP